MPRPFTNLAERARILSAIEAAPEPLYGRGGAGQYWVKPNASSRIMVGYHPHENITYFHDDVVLHEDHGDSLGLMDRGA